MMNESRCVGAFPIGMFILLLSTFLILSPNHIQAQSMTTTKPPKINIKITPSVITVGQNNAWLMVRGGIRKDQQIFMHNLPAEMKRAVENFTNTNQIIQAAYLGLKGNWIVVGDRSIKSQGIDLGIQQIVQHFIDRKIPITCIAFDTSPKHPNGFVVVADDQIVSTGVSNDLQEVFKVIREQKDIVRSVAFTPEGGWTVITNSTQYTVDIPSSRADNNFHAQLKALRSMKKNPIAAAFPMKAKAGADQPWIILVNEYYVAYNPSPELAALLKDQIKMEGEILRDSGAAKVTKQDNNSPGQPDTTNSDQARAPQKQDKKHPLSKNYTLHFEKLTMLKNEAGTKTIYGGKHFYEAEGSEPLIFLIRFKGKLGDPDNSIILYDQNALPLIVRVAKSPFKDTYRHLNSNWVQPGKDSSVLFPKSIKPIDFTLAPYEYYGVIMILAEYGKDMSVADMQKQVTAGFKVASKQYQQLMKAKFDHLNFKDTDTPTNVAVASLQTMMTLEVFYQQIHVEIHDAINEAFAMSSYDGRSRMRDVKLYNPYEDPEMAFVRSVSMAYTINIPQAKGKDHPHAQLIEKQLEQYRKRAVHFVKPTTADESTIIFTDKAKRNDSSKQAGTTPVKIQLKVTESK